ncbi:hypothetical protein Syun_019738 [Stephania yunnanensis]|uniref:Uncharacterized protein n=1 Tax=Stephania yunnanensis TaxID=152371 RepID=A0AAP0IUN5_9MAGN
MKLSASQYFSAFFGAIEGFNDSTFCTFQVTMEKFENVDYGELGFDPHIYGLLTVTMEKFENVDYNELGFDPHIYGLLTVGQFMLAECMMFQVLLE